MKNEALKSRRTFWKVSAYLPFLILAALPYPSAAQIYEPYFNVGSQSGFSTFGFTTGGFSQTFQIFPSSDSIDSVTMTYNQTNSSGVLNTEYKICRYDSTLPSVPLSDCTGSGSNHELLGTFSFPATEDPTCSTSVTHSGLGITGLDSEEIYYVFLTGQSTGANRHCIGYNDSDPYAYGDMYQYGQTYSSPIAGRDMRLSVGYLYLDELAASVTASNFPAALGGITYSGSFTPAADLDDGEYIIDAAVDIYHVENGSITWLETFPLTVDEITSATGTFATSAAALNFQWPVGTHTVTFEINTNIRTSTDSVLVTVQDYTPTAGGGGGGGSWGDENLSPTIPGVQTPDASFKECFLEAFSDYAFTFLSSPSSAFDPVLEGVKCIINGGVNAIKKVPPVKWAYEFNDGWNSAVQSGTDTTVIAIDVGMAHIPLYNSSTNTGMFSQVGANSPVKQMATYAIDIAFALYLLSIAYRFRAV